MGRAYLGERALFHYSENRFSAKEGMGCVEVRTDFPTNVYAIIFAFFGQIVV